MADSLSVAGRRRAPLPTWARRLLVVFGVLVVFGLAMAVITPFRRVVALGTSKVILVLASPFAPKLDDFNRLPEGSKVLAADGSVLADLAGTERREPVRLADLPEHVRQAVLAAEDANFYGHSGMDPAALFRAGVRTAQGQTQGGSTITQQLAKINYTNRERSVLRKFRELQYAVRLEKEYSKDQLLERYLNQVYFGEGAYGIASASTSFFGVPAAQLTPAQAAVLAGKIRAPEGLDPRTDPEAMTARRDQVLRNMQRRGWLTGAAYDEALATPLTLAPPPASVATRAPHFVELVKREAATIEALGPTPEGRVQALFNDGYKVQTTLDPAAFDASAATVQSNLGLPDDPATAVVSVVPGDGAISNLFAGATFDRKFDVASQGRRQPGSAFKPFVYLTALRDGIDPRSTMDSTAPKQLEYKGERYPVNNYADGQAEGPMTIDEAMVKSINTVFAQLILEVGPPKVVDLADQLGMPGVNANPAIALGGLREGVSPLQMAAAYAAIAAKGNYAEPYAIRTITDPSGKVVYTHDTKVRQVLDPREAGVMTATLQQVVERGTATAARIGRPQAGKTGTTQNYRDAWFVGFVPQLSTAVWVGYPDDDRQMESVHGQRVSGGSFPARIWAAYMRVATASMPIKPLGTASPDSLSLNRLDQPLVPPSTDTTLPTTSSTTATTIMTSTTTSPGPAPTPTTAPATTTTTRPAASTTTTTKPKGTTTSSTTSTTTLSSATTSSTSPPSP